MRIDETRLYQNTKEGRRDRILRASRGAKHALSVKDSWDRLTSEQRRKRVEAIKAGIARSKNRHSQ